MALPGIGANASSRRHPVIRCSGHAALMARVLQRSNLERACRKVRYLGAVQHARPLPPWRYPPKPRLTPQERPNPFKELHDRISEIATNVENLHRQALEQGVWVPGRPTVQKRPKPGGGSRRIRKPPPLDKIVQRALYQVLAEELDGGFSDNSFAYRPGRNRNVYQAVRRAQERLRDHHWVVKVDLRACFDRITQDRLCSYLLDRGIPPGTVQQIRLILRAYHPSRASIPQGSPLSPLLCNAYLDPFDRQLEKRGWLFVRWADDLLLFARKLRQAKALLRAVTGMLQAIGMEPGDKGPALVERRNLVFLGYRVQHFIPTPEAILKHLGKVDAHFRRCGALPLDRMKSWIAHHRGCEDPRPFRTLDAWWTDHFGEADFRYEEEWRRQRLLHGLDVPSADWEQHGTNYAWTYHARQEHQDAMQKFVTEHMRRMERSRPPATAEPIPVPNVNSRCRATKK